MATNTYVALDRVTVGTATPSITFTGISQAYTDLILIVSGTDSANASVGVSCRVGNGSVDSGANYSDTYIYGNGSSALSGRQSSVNSLYVGRLGTGQGNGIAHFQNYSNTTTFKTVLARGNDSAYVFAYTNLWRSTAAINTIYLFSDTASNFAVGSTFSLYGIRAEGVSPAAKATGGAIYSDSTYYYHAFAASGTFTPTQSISADVLVVAGGGAGGGERAGGGGGAGGLLAFTSQTVTSASTVTVGAGGAGVSGNRGGAGTNSQFASLTASVGGGGGGGASTKTGGNGGSGGGGLGFDGGGSNAGGTPTSGQGNAGSASAFPGNYAAGGGGGATAAGQTVTSASTVAADGGAGSSAYSSWGSATGVGQNVSGTYYLAGGGGGGGSPTTTQGAGGNGGGAAGGANTSNPAANALTNTGGGGGGSGLFSVGAGSNGGSGIVIIRYLKA